MNTPPRPRLAVWIGLYAFWTFVLGQPAALAIIAPRLPLDRPNITALGLKLPFEPGTPWNITNGWDAHARYEDINGAASPATGTATR